MSGDDLQPETFVCHQIKDDESQSCSDRTSIQQQQDFQEKITAAAETLSANAEGEDQSATDESVETNPVTSDDTIDIDETVAIIQDSSPDERSPL